ncbi:MAG: organic solvent tolerance protein OstA, partial [Aquimarina sp.]|nr:organic solvent tolerance protein OstA [Aquimarina sp.]
MALQKLSHSFTKIGFKPLQTTVRNILYSLSFSLFFIGQVVAQETNKNSEVQIPATQDSTEVNSVKPSDSLTITSEEILSEQLQDTVKKDSVKPDPEYLTDNVVYKAKDYMRLSRRENKMYLYDDAQITYGDIQL